VQSKDCRSIKEVSLPSQILVAIHFCARLPMVILLSFSRQALFKLNYFTTLFTLCQLIKKRRKTGVFAARIG